MGDNFPVSNADKAPKCLRSLTKVIDIYSYKKQSLHENIKKTSNTHSTHHTHLLHAKLVIMESYWLPVRHARGEDMSCDLETPPDD